MGGFYHSLHIRSGDYAAIKAALYDLGRKEKWKFLLAPPISGWISVYPDSPHENPASAMLARTVRSDILELAVHDNDVFMYWYYRNGRLVDEYNSCPEYFGEEVSATRKRALLGDHEVFAHLVDDPRKIEELRLVLKSPSDTDQAQTEPPAEVLPEDAEAVFASLRMQHFATLLGLPNAVTSYQYLGNGETVGITDWDKFIEVP